MTCIATVGTIIFLFFCGLIIYVAGYTTGCEHGFDDAKKELLDTKEDKTKQEQPPKTKK